MSKQGSSPLILKSESAPDREAALDAAARLLRAGEVVALPTETVYGLAANALNPVAIQKIYEVKGRPSHNPIIVHVASLEMARTCVAQWPDSAAVLAKAFWPGPLTLVLPKTEQIPEIVTAGGSTVAIRWPSHAFVQELIARCGFPLAAPSANLSGQISPTTAEHVRQSLGDRVPLIIDGGRAEVGIESTVLDVSVDPPRILRPGMIHSESLMAVIGPLASKELNAPGALRSPGLLLKHYAPKAQVLLWTGAPADLAQVRGRSGSIHFLGRNSAPVGVHFDQVSQMPRDPESFARALYAELHRCDAAGAAVICVELPPSGAAWQGITDRLRRAAAS